MNSQVLHILSLTLIYNKTKVNKTENVLKEIKVKTKQNGGTIDTKMFEANIVYQTSLIIFLILMSITSRQHKKYKLYFSLTL